ncbi:MAG: leucine-rich repeat domain-containing protein [Bacteroidales bacterium]|nr:leucine-rich repeat domain-containing protein [Bacteroidales bacterium]
MKKKALLLLATLLAIGQTVWASYYDFSYTYQGTTLYYNINGSTVYVTSPASSYGSYSGYIIPTGDVVIPNSVTRSNGITYPVTAIGHYAFHGCTGITSVTIGNSVTEIGGSAFSECTSLTTVSIGNSVTSIGSYAFQNCPGLTSVNIGNSVASIGEYAFSGCNSLTSIDISNSVTKIGAGAFYGCSGLTSITIPADSIGDYAFQDCVGINSVTFDNSSFFIGNGVFKGCSGLTSITIGNSVNTIGNYVFQDCTGLTSVTIGNSVTSIGASVFVGCTGLTSIVVSNGNSHYDSRNNCNAIIETSNNTLIAGCQNTMIPNTVAGIGAYAFNGCTGLTSVNIPNSVVSISNYAFYNCTGLTSVTLGNSVTGIYIYAFSGCSSLTSVTIPRSVTVIGDYAFRGCRGLTSVVFNADSCTYAGERRWKTDHYEYYTAFDSLSNIITFTFGGNVKVIPNYLCYGLRGLASVNIPGSVTTIGHYPFIDCSGLTSVEFNAYRCMNGFNANMFPGCHNISNFTIGDSVKIIPNHLCESLSNITTVAIPNSVTYIGNRAFLGCIGLTSTVIPNSVTYMGDSVFLDCTSLSTAVIGNSVTNISGNTFANCNHLTNLTLGSGVRTIAADAFSGCNAVLRLTSLATVPPTAPSNPFTDFNTSIPVYVPCNSVEAYKNAAYWGFFSNIQCDNTGIDDIDAAGVSIFSVDGRIIVSGAEGDTVQVYDLMGHAVGRENLSAGTYMVKVGDHPARKVVVIR